MSQITATTKNEQKLKKEWIKSGFRVIFKEPRFMKHWLRSNAWYSFMKNNYDMV